MEHRYRPTWSDLLEFNRHLPHVRLARWITTAGGLGITAFGATLALHGHRSPDPTLIWAWGLVLTAVGLAAPWLSAAGAWARRTGECIVSITADGITVTEPGGTAAATWDEFRRARETPKLILLYGGMSGLAVFIPKRALPGGPAGVEQLRAAAGARVEWA